MSVLEMKVPSPGESISEVEIAEWLVSDGDYVMKDQAIAEVDSDKATLELPAEEAGIITLKAEAGDVVAVGQVVCLIDTSATPPAGATAPKEEKKEEVVVEVKEEKKVEAPKAEAAPQKDSYATGTPSPAAAKAMRENNVSAGQVAGTGKGGRITKQDVLNAMAAGFDTETVTGWGGTREKSEQRMSMLRRKVAERLVAVKSETAMLTTFNEVDMSTLR